MKNLRTLLLPLLVLPLFLGFTSCNDDDDLPNVDLTINISGATSVDGTIYVVQGDTITIEGITVTNLDSKKAASITAATFYWDYFRLGTALTPPYGFKIATTPETSLGKHLLEIESPVYAVDKAPGVAIQVYDVVVVANADDIPSGTASQSISADTNVTDNN